MKLKIDSDVKVKAAGFLQPLPFLRICKNQYVYEIFFLKSATALLNFSASAQNSICPPL